MNIGILFIAAKQASSPFVGSITVRVDNITSYERSLAHFSESG